MAASLAAYLPAVQFGVLPGVWIFGAAEPAAPQLAERRVQRIQVGGGHELVHPRRRQPDRLGQGADRDPLGRHAARETRVSTRRSRLPASIRSLIVTRPTLPAVFRKLDAIAVLTARLLPVPLLRLHADHPAFSPRLPPA